MVACRSRHPPFALSDPALLGEDGSVKSLERRAAGRDRLEIRVGARRVERLLRTRQADTAGALALRPMALLQDHAPDNLDRGDIWLQCPPRLLAGDAHTHLRRMQRAKLLRQRWRSGCSTGIARVNEPS